MGDGEEDGVEEKTETEIDKADGEKYCNLKKCNSGHLDKRKVRN